MRIAGFCLVFSVIAGCTPEIDAEMAEDFKPRVVGATPVSVTISQHGNDMVNRDPEQATLILAEQTCKGMGKQSAVYSSYTRSGESNFLSPEYMRNHHFFLCQ